MSLTTNPIALLERILSREGYQVTAVHGSEEALYQLGRKSFDLAILDIKMYPMNGVELLAEIKKRSPSTRVIMVSGNLTDDIRALNASKGFDKSGKPCSDEKSIY